MMNVEVTQVANGWMVRKVALDRNSAYRLDDVMVFNRFEDLSEYLKTLSGKTQ